MRKKLRAYSKPRPAKSRGARSSPTRCAASSTIRSPSGHSGRSSRTRSSSDARRRVPTPRSVSSGWTYASPKKRPLFCSRRWATPATRRRSSTSQASRSTSSPAHSSLSSCAVQSECRRRRRSRMPEGLPMRRRGDPRWVVRRPPRERTGRRPCTWCGTPHARLPLCGAGALDPTARRRGLGGRGADLRRRASRPASRRSRRASRRGKSGMRAIAKRRGSWPRQTAQSPAGRRCRPSHPAPATAGSWSTRCTSIRGCGDAASGATLLTRLLADAPAHGIWTIQTSIIASNEASLRLHEAVGFRVVGRRERIAQRDGVWHDTILLERRLP